MYENRYKDTLKTLYIYDLLTFFKQLLKKTFKPNKENPNMTENLC